MEQYQEFITNHPYLFAALAAIVGMIVYTELQQRLRRFKDLTPMQATRLQNDGEAVFLDVRDLGEYNSGHLLNAKHIPVKNLGQRLGELQKYKDKPIVAYCATGSRSFNACKTLEKNGYEPVYNLAGGLMAWEKANLPVVRK